VTGLETRPLRLHDADEVARVWRACEQHDDGDALFTEEDFVAASKRPSMDLARHTVGVWENGTLVALALLYGEDDVFAHVLPSHRGRGIGAWLLRWTQQAGRSAGYALSCQMLSEQEHAARALLEADGYERRYEGWIFDRDLVRAPDPPSLPAGYALREFHPGHDDRDVHRVIGDAFGEWREHAVGTFEDWAAEMLGRPGFMPELVALAVRGEQVVGAAVLVDDEDALWVAQLAVAKPHRGRGLGRALLAHAFGVSWRAGHRQVRLGTDSRTGARALYEHVGMRVQRSYAEYAKPL
jgi:mycothiol synthase